MSRTTAFRLAMACFLLFVFHSDGWAKKRKRPAKTVRAALMPVKARGLTADEARAIAGQVGKTVVRELRSLGVVKLLVGKQIKAKLKKLKKKKVLVKGCAEKRKCVRSVGRNLRVKVLYFLEVAKGLDGINLTVSALDVRSGKEVRKSVEVATREPADLDRAARWAARKASSPMISKLLKGKGRLLVKCDVDEVDLFINGKSFGNRTNKAFKVGSGVFDLQVKKDGYLTFHDVVVVKPNKDLEVQAELQKVGGTAGPVVGAADPEDPKPLTPESKDDLGTKPKADLPAWAIFEKPKKTTPPVDGTDAAKTDPGTKPDSAAIAKVDPQPEPKPFLPKEDPVEVPAEKVDDDSGSWYTAWWFWTVVGVAVAGGVGGGLYAGGVFDTGDGGGPTGDALVTWQ